jgi:hypothetical protein
VGRERELWRRAIDSTTLRRSAVALAFASILTGCGAEEQADPCSLLTTTEASQILHATPSTGKPFGDKVDEKSSFDLAHAGGTEEHGCIFGSLDRVGVGVDITTFTSARRARAYVADDLKAKPAGYVRVSPNAAINEQIIGGLVGTAIDDRRVLSMMAVDARNLDAGGNAHPDFNYALYRQVFKRASQDF